MSCFSLGVVALALTTAAVFAQGDAGVVTGGRSVHILQQGETLTSVGARHGMTPRVLAKMNSLRTDARLAIGQQLNVDSRHVVPAFTGERLIVNVPQRMLFLSVDEEQVAGFPVAVGRASWPTFTGPFLISTLETNPVWDVPVSIQEELRRAGKPVLEHVPPGPNNPLGAHWIGLSQPGFGIHSTNAPASIYGFVTHGCIRLHPDDAEYVFSNVAVGMSGRITYEPVLLARTSEGEILLEAHPDVYRRQPDAMAAIRDGSARLGLTELVDWTVAAGVLKARDGVPMDISIQGRR